MRNKNIRNTIEKLGLRYWKVAEVIGISPTTLCIWLRQELTGERLERVEAAITTLSKAGDCK